MRKLYLLLLVLLITIVLVACTPPEKENLGVRYDFSELYGEKQTITVWFDDANGQYMQALVEAFNSTDAGKNIIVQYQHMQTAEALEKLTIFGPTGNAADIFQLTHTDLSAAILKDLIYALPSNFADVISERVHPLAIDIATLSYDETTRQFGSGLDLEPSLYGVPMSLETIGLYYNKDLVSIPATTYEALLIDGALWNALENTVDNSGLTNEEKGWHYLGTTSSWTNPYFMQHIYSAFGFMPFGPNSDDANAVDFDDVTNALSWLINDLKPVATRQSDSSLMDVNSDFIAGHIPYILANSSHIDTYKNTTLDFGIAQLPTINGQATTPFAGTQMAAIYKYSENKEAAATFLEFLTSDAAMSIQLEMTYKLPALKYELLSNIQGFSTDEHMVAIASQLSNAKPVPTILEATFYFSISAQMAHSTWYDNVGPNDAILTAQTAYDALKDTHSSS